jgi:hypothetical protein
MLEDESFGYTCRRIALNLWPVYSKTNMVGALGVPPAAEMRRNRIRFQIKFEVLIQPGKC